MGIVRDLKLDPGTVDLVVEGGDLVLVEDLAAISQAVRTRLRFFRGEWFGDLDVGVPYYENVYLKNPNMLVVRETLRAAIIGTTGIAEILTFDVTLDAATRTLSLAFSARADTGALLVFDEKLSPTPEVT